MARPKGSKNKPKEHNTLSLGENSREKLRGLIDRIEALEEEKQILAEDIKEVFTEAKEAGFDTTAMRAVIKLRRQDKADRDAKQAIVDSYMHALGMLADTPLGKAAIERASAAV